MNAEPGLYIIFTEKEIEATVDRLAAEISRDYRDKNPLLIGILKGSFLFLADLIRHLDFPLEVDFIGLSSYGKGRETSGEVKVVEEIRSSIQGREVLIIEDIVDTGLTTSFLLNDLRKKKPASLKLCTLTDKPSRRQVPVAIDYLGLTAPDKFLVGYGLDCNEKFRNLPEMYFLEEN